MVAMTAFTGFPAGKNPYVPVPEVFFTVLLPEIEDVTELKVTLHLFWLLAQKQGNPRCVNDQELLTDETLLHSLKRRGDPRPVEERLRQGLEHAIARGTILRINLKLVHDENSQPEIISWYFFNTARSRKVVSELQGGEMVPVRLLTMDDNQIQTPERIEQRSEVTATHGGRTSASSYESSHAMQVQVERPNIFMLYEQNIGLLSPLIADELKDAAVQYPPEWIEAAFREAVQQNKRKWSYIRAILRSWETEGRQSWNA